MPPSPVVHVVDDDDAVRDSLATLLETEGFEVSVHASAVEFLAQVEGLARGCVVTDVCMPGLSGLDLLRELRRCEQALPVIVLTGEADVAMAVEALKAGAAEFIEKPFDADIIVRAIRDALARLDRDDLIAGDQAATDLLLASLTARETEVLAGLVAGNSNKATARELGISPRTVEVYRSHIMSKMRVNSISELVRLTLTSQPAA